MCSLSFFYGKREAKTKKIPSDFDVCRVWWDRVVMKDSQVPLKWYDTGTASSIACARSQRARDTQSCFFLLWYYILSIIIADSFETSLHLPPHWTWILQDTFVTTEVIIRQTGKWMRMVYYCLDRPCWSPEFVNTLIDWSRDPSSCAKRWHHLFVRVLVGANPYEYWICRISIRLKLPE